MGQSGLYGDKEMHREKGNEQKGGDTTGAVVDKPHSGFPVVT